LGWWVGLDSWVMDLWVCCVAVKPQTSSGGGGYEGSVWGGGGLDLWVCYATVKPQIGGGGGGGCKGSVWSGGLWICGCCEAQISGCVSYVVMKPRSVVMVVNPHGEASVVTLFTSSLP